MVRSHGRHVSVVLPGPVPARPYVPTSIKVPAAPGADAVPGADGGPWPPVAPIASDQAEGGPSVGALTVVPTDFGVVDRPESRVLNFVEFPVRT